MTEAAVLSTSSNGETALWELRTRTPLVTYKENMSPLRGSFTNAGYLHVSDNSASIYIG